jgi:hypothetical protein
MMQRSIITPTCCALQVDRDALEALGSLQQLRELDLTVGAADMDAMLAALSNCPLLQVRRRAGPARAVARALPPPALRAGGMCLLQAAPAAPRAEREFAYELVAPAFRAQVLRLDYDSLPALLEDSEGEDGMDGIDFFEPIEDMLAGGWVGGRWRWRRGAAEAMLQPAWWALCGQVPAGGWRPMQRS